MSHIETVTPEAFEEKMLEGCKAFGADVEKPTSSSFGSVRFEYEKFIDFCARLGEMFTNARAEMPAIPDDAITADTIHAALNQVCAEFDDPERPAELNDIARSRLSRVAQLLMEDVRGIDAIPLEEDAAETVCDGASEAARDV